jgi:hypothetical protein
MQKQRILAKPLQLRFSTLPHKVLELIKDSLLQFAESISYTTVTMDIGENMSRTLPADHQKNKNVHVIDYRETLE